MYQIVHFFQFYLPGAYLEGLQKATKTNLITFRPEI
jgi:hypothetical protein